MKIKSDIILYVFIFIMTILLGVIYSLGPRLGDDIGYTNSLAPFADKFNGNEFLTYVYFIARKWFVINGRMADNLLIGLLAWVPDWIIGVFTALAWCVTAIIVIKLISRESDYFFIKTLCLCFLWVGLPMWDSSLLKAVALNYVWSTACGLIVAYIVININSIKIQGYSRYLFFLFSFLSGMMHEAMSLPLLIGFCAYLLINNGGKIKETIRNFRRNIKHDLQYATVFCFGIGTFVVIFSPALFRRFSNSLDTIPDDPVWLLFLKSDFLVIPLLLLSILVLCLDKYKFIRLVRSGWIIFAIAAVISACISSVSGIVGRSGWFSQVYSLIALGLLLKKFEIKRTNLFTRLFSYLLLGFVIFCYSEILFWQDKRRKEYDLIMKEYLASADGTVYQDYTDDYELPWYTLGMTSGVPDPDDTYLISNI